MMSAYPGAELKAIAAEDITTDAVGSRTQLRIKISQMIAENPNISRAELSMALTISKSNITAIFKEFGVDYKQGSLLLYKAFYSKSDLSNSQLADWSKALDPVVAEYVEDLLDSPNTSLEEKAEQVAIVTDALNSHELTALFDKLGATKTEFFLELLRLNLALLMPPLISESGIDTSRVA
jgi:hypothetical protein